MPVYSKGPYKEYLQTKNDKYWQKNNHVLNALHAVQFNLQKLIQGQIR